MLQFFPYSQAGVVGAIVVAEFPKDFPRVLQLAQQFPDFVRPALGLHPVQVHTFFIFGLSNSFCFILFD
jgi:Tat protein secretion system quality control protein TatD with DNase activity